MGMKSGKRTVGCTKNTHAKHGSKKTDSEHRADNNLFEVGENLNPVDHGHSGSRLALLGVHHGRHWKRGQLRHMCL